MFKLLSSVQDILLEQHKHKLRNLKYKNLLIADNKILPKPFDYFVLDQPPTNDSNQTLAELQEILFLTQSRSETDINEILLIDKDSISLYQKFLDSYNLKFPIEIFDRYYSILADIIMNLKLYFNRPRPNQIAEFYGYNIDVIHTKTHSTPSYPSGHTAYAKLAEMLASEYFPEHQNTFKDITKRVGLARMQQGVHFASDNAASIKLVEKTYNKIKELVL